MNKKIGFIGLGMMGKPMAMRMINAGYELVVYNRTKEKADELISKGAVWAESPQSVASKTEVVISMISTPEVLREIVLSENGILSGFEAGKTHIDMSTVSPAVIDELTEVYESRKINFIHAPVLGSVPNILDGSLLIFAGGDQEICSLNKNIFETLGKRVWFFPKQTHATNLKLACNLFIANMIVTLSQGLVFAEKAGIKPEILLEAIKESTLNATVYQFKGKAILENNFTPRFMTQHILKDIKLIIESAKKFDTNLPTMNILEKLFELAVVKGYGNDDYSSVYKVIKNS